MLLKSVCRAAVFMLLLVLPVACQQAYLIPDEEADYKEDARGEEGEAPKDSTTVTPDFDIDGWDEAINADFTFGGSEQKGGGE